MAEYAGYVASQPVDFGKIGSGLVSNLISIQEKKAEYDEKKQLALEKQQEKEDLLIDRDTQRIQDQINKDISSTGSQNLQRISGQSVSEAANAAAQLGRLAKVDRKNSYQYMQKAQSLARSVGGLRQTVDAWSKGSAEILKLSAGQDLDALGEAMAKDYIEAGDLNGVNAGVANDEKVVFYKKDPNTGEVIVMDPEVYTDYNRFVSKKIDYNKLFNDFTTNRIGEFESTSKGGPLTKIDTTSVMNNPLFQPEKKKFIGNLTATPFSTAKFLTTEDPSYQIYRNESEKKQLIEDGFDENKLIKLGKDEGGYPKPIITDDMKKAAEKLADDKIQASISYKTTERRNPNIIITTPREAKDIPRMDVVEAGKKVRQIELRDDSESIFKREPGYVKKLESLAKQKGYKDVQIVYRNGGLAILGKINKGDKVKTLQEFPNGEAIYSWRNGLDPIVGSNEYKELTLENKQDYLDIVQAGKGQMKARVAKSTGRSGADDSKTPDTEIKYFTIDQVKEKLGKNATQSQIDQYIKAAEASGKFKFKRR